MSNQDKTDYKRKFNADNYDRVGLYIKKDLKKKMDAHRAKTGESMNAFITRAISEQMERDKGV
jgi:hypothetical protein